MPTSYRIIFEATNVCVYTVITRLHNSSKGNRWCTVIENLAGTCHAEITISYCPSSHLTGHLLPVWKILPVETVLIMMLYSSPRGKATSTPTWPGTTSSATCSRGYSTEYPPKMCSQQFHLNWTETIFPYVIVTTCLDYLLKGKYTRLMFYLALFRMEKLSDGQEMMWAIINTFSWIVHRDINNKCQTRNIFPVTIGIWQMSMNVSGSTYFWQSLNVIERKLCRKIAEQFRRKSNLPPHCLS